MLISSVLGQARKLANDTDTSDPFHTDSDLYEFISDWLQEVAMEFGYPKKQQSIAFAANEGGASGTKNLDNDWHEITLVTFEITSSGNAYHLDPRTEAEMAAEDADWRDLSAANPSYYIVQDAITAQANALGPVRTVTTERLVANAGTMRLYGVQIPAVISAGTNSPVFQAAFHKSAVYYMAGQMLLPRDEKRGDYFLKLHEKKLRRCKTLVGSAQSGNSQIWDQFDGGTMTQTRLSKT